MLEILKREIYALAHEPLMWFCMIVAPSSVSFSLPP